MDRGGLEPFDQCRELARHGMIDAKLIDHGPPPSVRAMIEAGACLVKSPPAR
jgi:hypothetical protein